MANPLYGMMNGGMQNGMPGMGNIIQRFQQFRQTFQGDPRQQIQQLMNSGKVSQDDYNRAVQMANQLQKMLKFTP